MKPRVLVVDDEQDIRELLKFYLNKEGYEVLEAGDGEEALNIFENEYVDLGIIDVMMPKMDGFALTQAIRDGGSMMPILMLTAKALPEDKHTGFLVGTDDYMTKPFSTRELVSRIKAVLRRANAASG